MEIQGQISEIIYQNEINSYTIALFEIEEESITIVGYLPFVNNGDSLKIVGKYVTHQEYGEQFKIDTFEKIMPETSEALEKYLANGTIKGIGPSIAKKIVQTFGEDTINVFRYDPHKLAQIRGISKEKAVEMGEIFIENWELWQIVSFLERFGIGPANAKKVYKLLGVNAIDEIESNPYVLIECFINVDFKKLDKMALDLGVSYDNSKRIKSGIKYSLMTISYNGHTCCLKQNLISYVENLLGVNEDDIDTQLIDLNIKEEIYIEKRDEEEWVYLYPFYIAELNITQKIILLDSAKNIKKVPKFDNELNFVEKNSNIHLSEKQKEAIKAVNDNNVCVISGGPGTGKTTIIKSIIEIYKMHNKKVVLCAPTGRAAKRMTETTGEESKTLHRLLEIGKIEEEGKIASIDYDVAPIDADLIVIDEMSMVDVFLMNYLLKAVYQGTKLIMVGDVDQLPSVGPGSILKDIINSEKVTIVHLNKIFRQAAKSKIILNAHRVNNGELFINNKDFIEEDLIDGSINIDIIENKKKVKNNIELKEDFFYINENIQDRALDQIVSLCTGRLANYGNYDFFNNIQVLSATKKGILGTRELNKILQQEINPTSIEKRERKSGEIIFREGDRVMQIKNNYDIFWERKNNEYENGNGVFNGELGNILKINESEKQIKIKFDDEKVAWYTFSDLDQIEHAYAITIHKSQGSEFDVVIIVAPQTSPILLTRNLLYTGITRAKKLLIIVSNDKIIKYMIQNEDHKKRNTGLEYKLKEI